MQNSEKVTALIAQRIAHIRKSLKLKQEEFAARLGVDQTTVSKWERGKARPTPEALVRVARIADVGLDKLFLLDHAGLPEQYLLGEKMLPLLKRASAQVVEDAIGGDALVASEGNEEGCTIPLIQNIQDLGDLDALAELNFSFPSSWLPNNATVQAVRLNSKISPFVVGEVIALVDVAHRDPDRLQGCIVAARTNAGIEPMTLRKDGPHYFLVPLNESASTPVRMLRPRGTWSIVGKVLKWIGDAPSPVRK